MRDKDVIVYKKGQKSPSTLKKEREAKTWYYAIVFEVNPETFEDMETLKIMHTVFKKDGKTYYVMASSNNIGAVSCGMYSKGYGDYRIISKLGNKTKWEMGDWR